MTKRHILLAIVRAFDGIVACFEAEETGTDETMSRRLAGGRALSHHDDDVQIPTVDLRNCAIGGRERGRENKPSKWISRLGFKSRTLAVFFSTASLN